MGILDSVEVAFCSRCLGEIYENEYYATDTNNKPICIDCIEAEWSELADDEKINALGYDVEFPTNTEWSLRK